MSKLTAKERNLLKGAIRRVFSRSELRQKVVNRTLVADYSDPSRKRVKNWGRCEICLTLTPRSYLAVDHKDPVIPLDRSLEEMSWDELIDRIWCEESNLQAICPECHDSKTKKERKLRKIKRRL